MSNWLDLLQKPDCLNEVGRVKNWFTAIAQQLLNHSLLVVGEEPHRLAEIEFYCYEEAHPDRFAHCDRLQQECGRWYFHRTRGQYRGGSFKGLDLTFGDGTMYGGILLRSIETSEERLICGPSLCVDRLLAQTNARDVAALDDAIAQKVAWHPDSPLRLEIAPALPQKSLFCSGRVGLSLKRAKPSPTPKISNPQSPIRLDGLPWYILQPYRYLTEPQKISKGKPYLILALHARGASCAEIHSTTGSSKQSIQKYIADFEAGQQEQDFSLYSGIDLDTQKLCQLYGTWYKLYGRESEIQDELNP
jgi:hypothetical protein